MEAYWLERGHLRSLCKVVQTILHVVDGCAAVDTIEAGVGDLWDTLVGAVLGLEVAIMILETITCSSTNGYSQDSSPVVGEILTELAGCAS